MAMIAMVVPVSKCMRNLEASLGPLVSFREASVVASRLT